MVDTGASLLETMRVWVSRVGEDLEVVLLCVFAGAEDKIFGHVRNGDLDPVDVVVDLVDDSAVGSEDVVRIPDLHVVGFGVFEGVEAPRTVVLCRDDNLAGRQGAALVVGGRRERRSGRLRNEFLHIEIGVAFSASVGLQVQDHSVLVGFGTEDPLLFVGGAFAIIEFGVRVEESPEFLIFFRKNRSVHKQ